jgi:serine/threonine protein kinase
MAELISDRKLPARVTTPSTAPCLHCGAPVPPGGGPCPACGQPQVAEDPPEAWLGRVIDGKYRVESILGVGGMGMVFEARRVLIGDRVALKVLYPRFLASPLQRRLFRDEAIATARLSHENVLAVYDADVSAEGHAYIAMELLSGRTLKTVLREKAPMAGEELVGYLVEVCAGLEAAHRAQIIHRDLKPDNIFLEARPGGGERVKLLDFGIAAMLDADRRDEKRQRLGTLRYMAPEQCKGGAVDGRADLYALGVVCYEALTRRRATGKTVSAVLDEAPEPPNNFLPFEKQVAPPLEALVLRLLAKSPADRPPSAAAAGEAFAAVAAWMRGDPPPVARPVSTLPTMRPAPRASEHGMLWVGLGVAVLVGVIGGLLWGLF